MNRRQTAPKADGNKDTKLVLRLYVVSDAPNSVQAVDNIKAICHEHHRGAYRLDIIDVIEHPRRAMAAGVLVTPTLVKLSPAPETQVVGNLSDRQKVLLAIGSKEKYHE